jgi:hypothetical protein
MLDGFAFMLKHLLRAAVEPLEAQLTMFDCIPETDAAAKADIFSPVRHDSTRALIQAVRQFSIITFGQNPDAWLYQGTSLLVPFRQ